MTKKTPRVLITGATGFLGSWIIARLIDNAIPVVATDVNLNHHRLLALKPDLPDGLVDFRVCDVTDAEQVETLVAETEPSAIIHLAALQIPQCSANPTAGAMVNIVGHINMFEAARKHGISRMIYTSSIAAKPRGSANAPSNLYGVFKKTDEEIARIYWQDHKLPSLGLRPYIVYGVGRDEGETSAITTAIKAAALGQPYQIPFNTQSCFQYAGEVAEIFARAAIADWQGALLSDLTDRVHSIDDVLQAIQTVVPGAAVTRSEQNRISPTSGFETAPLHQVIGTWQETSLEDGVRQSAALFQKIEAQQSGS